MTISKQRIEAILGFWFQETPKEKHFAKDEVFDKIIRQNFENDYDLIVKGGVEDIKQDPRASLAAILVLDQFSRNMFRGEAKAFAADRMALELSRHAIAESFDEAFPEDERAFIYMPLMHAEERGALNECVAAFTRLGDENFLKYAIAHKEIIDRFGRYPHRNEVLGRESTEDEIAFNKEHGGF